MLGAGFTASVNVAMQVGSLEETITVSGAAPVVDTQSMRRQETLNTSELEALPSGNIGLQTLAYVTPGFAATQADVGGTRDTWSAQGNYTFYPRQDRHARLVRRLPQPVLHRRGLGRRLHHRQRQHRGTAARDERHGRRIGIRQHLAERHPQERQQHLRGRPRRVSSRTAPCRARTSATT